MLYPDHIELFRKTIRNSKEVNGPISTELCYKLIDDEKLKHFIKTGKKNYQLIVEGLNAGILFQDATGELVFPQIKKLVMY